MVKPENVDELWTAVQEEWYKIPYEVIKNLYLSMTERLNELKKRRKSYTRY